MTESEMWNNEESLESLGISVPDWIEGDLSPSDVIAIYQGGCASGAYMPAVVYHTALETMHEHGDQVLDFIFETCGKIIAPPENDRASWSHICCFYLSSAVELWASDTMAALERIEDVIS